MSTVEEQTHQKSYTAVWLPIVVIILVLLVGCGAGLYWFTQAGIYPAAERLTGVGKCGTADSYSRGRTVRLSTQRCFATADSPALVGHWYLTRGYQWQNDGYVQHQDYAVGVVFLRTERVYPLRLEDGRTDIRIYTDYTLRLP